MSEKNRAVIWRKRSHLFVVALFFVFNLTCKEKTNSDLLETSTATLEKGMIQNWGFDSILHNSSQLRMEMYSLIDEPVFGNALNIENNDVIRLTINRNLGVSTIYRLTLRGNYAVLITKRSKYHTFEPVSILQNKGANFETAWSLEPAEILKELQKVLSTLPKSNRTIEQLDGNTVFVESKINKQFTSYYLNEVDSMMISSLESVFTRI